MSAYRIALADDHVLVRQGFRRILEGVGDLEVIGEANDGIELLDLLRRGWGIWEVAPGDLFQQGSHRRGHGHQS